MKIIHICLASFFPDNFSYQENILPKFHKRLGHNVEVLASLETFDSKGKPSYMVAADSYINENGIKVTRIPYLFSSALTKKIKLYRRFDYILEAARPDIIFVHGCQFLSIYGLIRYIKKKTGLRVYVDNHADEYNSGKNILSKWILHKVLWKFCAHAINKYTTCFYGVTPGRVEFLIEQYNLEKKKCRLLLMGGDDDCIKIANANKASFKDALGISEEDFVIVTGGKINAYRPETLDLMKAITNLRRSDVKLVVFGVVDDSLKDAFEALLKSPQIMYAGWLNSQETYNVMAIADLIIFPGLHSVMWEQACALGKPAIFRKLKGFEHLDLGGNAMFLENVTEERLRLAILSILENKDKLKKMKQIAQEKGKKLFSYQQIAKESIEL